MLIFVDSDIVISSLLSSSGAAHFLIHNPEITPVISNLSIKELEIVIERLSIDKAKFEKLIKDRIKIINLSSSITKIKRQYADYVTDQFDPTIIAGAIAM